MKSVECHNISKLNKEENKTIYTKEQYDLVFKLLEQELNYRQISKTTGIKYSQIRSWLVYGRKPCYLWTETENREYRKKLSVARRKRKCSEETKRKISLSKLGEKNPNWKGDDAKKGTGWDRARRIYPAPKGYDRHHIDGNPLNNDPINVLIIPRRKHMKIDGRLDALINKTKEGVLKFDQ